MATSKIFKKVPTVVPNRSGFNMSYNNFFTAPVGTLVPSHIDFLLPGDEIDLASKLHIQLPPMATDFYGRIEAKEEAFFVPARILFGGWKDFYVNPVDGTTNPSNIDGQLAKYLIGATINSVATSPLSSSDDTNPTYSSRSVGSLTLDVLAQQFEKAAQDSLLKLQNFSGSIFSINDDINLKAGSLADYLGFKVGSVSSDSKYQEFFEICKTAIINGSESTISDGVTYILGLDTYPVEDVLSSLASQSKSVTSDGSTISVTLNWIWSYDVAQKNVACYFLLSFTSFEEDIIINNILPFMAYHKVYDDWYRSPQLQQSLFKRNVANTTAATSVANMPWITSGAESKVYFEGTQLSFANGHHLFDLHQRNWQKDYFTSATPEPQAGEASKVTFDVVDESGEFTIASLRAANALQQWLDKNNIGGFRYGEMIYAQYGVYPSDATTDRAIYLGSTSVDVYNKSVYQQSGDGGEDTNNPFNAIGSKYSNPCGVGDGYFCDNYSVTEAGFVIKIFSLVPQAYYSTGVRRMFNYNDISDIAFPVLAGVGDQPIFARELVDVFTGVGDDTVFGYQQRYAEYKFIDDQVHGLLRDGESLSSFALQRSFSSVPELGSEFIQIPRDYLDQVSATNYKLSNYGCWVNCYNDYRKSSTLPAYSIPTLENMKGHTVIVDKGGKYL